MATFALNVAVAFATSYLLSLFSPTQKAEGPRLSDLSAPKSSYGAPIPRVYGSARIAGNFIWGMDIRETVTTEKQGGKGGGGGVQSTTYAYYGTFAVLLCEGEVAIKRIWLNSKLVYNVAPDATPETYNASLTFSNRIRFYSGSSTQPQDSLIAATEGVSNTPAYRGRAYIVFDDIPLAEYGNRIPAVSCEVVRYGSGYFDNGRLYSIPTNVGAIAQDICQRVGFNLADIDTTEVNDIPVHGFWTNTNASARDALGQLQKVFFFDVIESGGKLKFIKQIRPNPPLSIPFIDLSTHEFGQGRPEEYTITRTQNTEIPDEVSVTYLDPDFAYQQASQTAKRPISPNRNKEDLKFDIVLTASQSLAIARKYLYLAWAQRRKIQFRLSLKYSSLEPGDVISVPIFGDPQLFYLIKINIGANFLLECEAIPYEPSILALTAVATAPAINLSIPSPQTSQLYLLDTNLFKDTDTDFGIYVGADGNNSWRQGSVYVSRNSGNSYDLIQSLITRTTAGNCLTVLGGASQFIRDKKNTLTVFVNGELESINDIDFLNGRNCALIGEEIIFFKNATLTAANTYVLSELLRGRRGTEWAINGHSNSEPFILASGYIERIPGEQLDINAQRLYKVLTTGQLLEDVSPFPFTSIGNSLKPYAPCHIKGTRDSSENLTISWIRRTRRGGELVDFKDADLSELIEAYEIDILNNNIVIRTLSATTATATYTAAQQIEDFGTAQPSIAVRAYQLSAYVGRGYPEEAVI